MALERVFTHPILIHRRSRSIFFWYTAAVGLLCSLLWWNIRNLVHQAGINLATIPSSPNPMLSLLLSIPFEIALAFFSAFIAAGLTAAKVVGPVKRIEQWLKDWEAGHRISPLKVRSRDQYRTLITLMNDLHIKSTHLSSSSMPQA